jgi:tetratricopeptide (TPR) repeat protein
MQLNAHGKLLSQLRWPTLQCDLAGIDMIRRYPTRNGTALALFALTILSGHVRAQAAHCFNSLNGPEVPCTPAGGGGGAAVTPAGPSPEEIAAQRQRATALELDKKASNDPNIQGNRWYTKAMLADSAGRYVDAAADFKRALHFFPDNRAIASGLPLAERRALMAAGNWRSAIEKARKMGVPKDSYYVEYLEGRQALDLQEWDKAIEGLSLRVKAMLASKRRTLNTMRNLQAIRPFPQVLYQIAKKTLAGCNKELAEVGRYLKLARARKARDQELAREDEALRKADASAPSALPVSQVSDKKAPPKEIAQSNCTGWMTQSSGTPFRLCTDEHGQRYCEQTSGNGVSPVSCQ